MKKIAVLAIVLFAFSSVSAFAWTDGSYALADTNGSLVIGGTTGETVTVKLSNKVSLAYKAETTAGLGYTVGTYHATGTKSYGSSSGDSKIFFRDATGVVPPSTAPTGTGSADFTAWKPM